TAVDPAAVACRLFLEESDAVALVSDRAVASRWLSGGHRRQTVLRAVQFDGGGDVDVTDAVTVSQAKRFVVFDVRQDALDPSADHRVIACVDQRDCPRLRGRVMYRHAVVRKIERYVRVMQKIV